MILEKVKCELAAGSGKKEWPYTDCRVEIAKKQRFGEQELGEVLFTVKCEDDEGLVKVCGNRGQQSHVSYPIAKLAVTNCSTSRTKRMKGTERTFKSTSAFQTPLPN